MSRNVAIKCFWMIFIILFSIGLNVKAQGDEERLDSIRARLDRLIEIDKAFLTEIDISVGRVSLGELLRNIAKVNGVNLSIKVDEVQMVTCNFNRAKISDLIFFLCKEYNLEAELIGNILSISTPPLPVPAPHVPKVSIDSSRGNLLYDLRDDNLVEVVKMISQLTGEHIIVPRNLYGQMISGYSAGLPVTNAIEYLASVNHLEIERDDNGVWTLYGQEVQPMGGGGQIFNRRRNISPDQIIVDSLGLITANINSGSIHDIVFEICERLHYDRIFLSPLEQQAGLFVKGLDFHSFLNVLFAGTSFSYQQENGVYFFGTIGKDKSLMSTKVIPMKYRSVDSLANFIPRELIAGMELKEFSDLNSFIASGSARQIERLEQFLESVDKTIPMITIEVMIVNSVKTITQEVGIKAGIGGEQATYPTEGSLAGVNMHLSSASVNKLINSFNGFGSINLGKVTPDFYMSLHALEDFGNIEIQSTPKLSTLNGRKATLSSGTTEYYKEIQNSYMGTQNPVQTESYQWVETTAELRLDIVPFVSEDGKITLKIDLEQSEFLTDKVDEAPPGKSTRNFNSIIQVQNEEMILLGGIDKNSNNKVSSGLPFLARLPVLRWLFGYKKDVKKDEKLNIFIKPTVIY